MSNNIFFHVDIDAFFASVHQLENPGLKGKPVIIGYDGQRGVVSTCSYEARKYGVHSAMPVAKAKQLCPKGIFIAPDMELYLRYSKKVMEIMSGFGPEIQQISIDEAFVNMSGTEKLLGPPEESAEKLKSLIKKESGLTVSIGIAENKYLAKIASDYNKPDGLTIIKPEEACDFIKKLPLKKLWGIGPKTLEKLHRIGITKTEQAVSQPLETLRKAVGIHGGEFIYKCVRGIDPGICSEQVDSKSISTEHTLGVSETNRDFLESMLLEMSDELRFRLINENLQSKTLCIKIRYDDFKTETIQITRQEPFFTIPEVFAEAKKLFYKKWNGEPVRLLGMGFHNIEEAEEYNQNLFTDEKKEKQIKLEETLAKIRNKYTNSIKNARFLIILLSFITSGFFFTNSAYSENFPALSSNIFNCQIGDKNVKIIAGGTWEISWIDFGVNFSSADNKISTGFLPGILSQNVDLSLNLEIDNHWFFKGAFSKGFTKNLFSMEYRNDDKSHNNIIKEISVGNFYKKIPLDFKSINLNNTGNNLKITGVFSAQNLDFFSIISFAENKLQEKIFYGYNEITPSLLSVKSSIKGRWFIIPANTVTLDKISEINIYVETENGFFKGTDNKRYKLLENNEFLFIKNQGLIALKTNHENKILISFYDENHIPLPFDDISIINDTVIYFNKSEIDIIPYLLKEDNKIVNINSEKAYTIQSVNNFNPLLINSRYYIPGNISLESKEQQQIKLVYKSTREEVKNYFVRNGKESFSVSEFSYFELSTDNGGNYYRPENRFPLANPKTIANNNFSPNPGLIYLPAEKLIQEDNINIGFEYTVPADTGTTGEIFIDYNINPDSITVYRGLLKTEDYSFNQSDGTITLKTPPKETEIIRVTYEKLDSDISNVLKNEYISNFRTITAMDWTITPDFHLSLAGEITWPVNKKKILNSTNQKSGKHFRSRKNILFKPAGKNIE